MVDYRQMERDRLFFQRRRQGRREQSERLWQERGREQNKAAISVAVLWGKQREVAETSVRADRSVERSAVDLHSCSAQQLCTMTAGEGKTGNARSSQTTRFETPKIFSSSLLLCVWVFIFLCNLFFSCCKLSSEPLLYFSDSSGNRGGSLRLFLQQRGVIIISVTAVTKLQQLSAVTLWFLHAVHMVVSHFLPLVWRMPAGAWSHQRQFDFPYPGNGYTFLYII